MISSHPTVGFNGFSMVLGSFNHWFQWFSMVMDHGSNNAMVSMYCSPLCIVHCAPWLLQHYVGHFFGTPIHTCQKNTSFFNIVGIAILVLNLSANVSGGSSLDYHSSIDIKEALWKCSLKIYEIISYLSILFTLQNNDPTKHDKRMLLRQQLFVEIVGPLWIH